MEFMEFPSEALTQRTYNVTAMSFSPEELVEEMKRYYPNMRIDYEPDERKQSIGQLGYCTCIALNFHWSKFLLNLSGIFA